MSAWAFAEEGVRRRNGRAALFALGPYCALGAFIAFLPEDFAAQLSLNSANVLGFIPGIAVWPAVSSHPEVTRLFMSVMWLGLPIAALALGRLWILPAAIYHENALRKLELLGGLFIVLALVVFVLAFPPEELLTSGLRGARAQRLIADTHVGLAVFGPLFFSVLAFLIGVALRILCHVLTGQRDAT